MIALHQSWTTSTPLEAGYAPGWHKIDEWQLCVAHYRLTTLVRHQRVGTTMWWYKTCLFGGCASEVWL